MERPLDFISLLLQREIVLLPLLLLVLNQILKVSFSLLKVLKATLGDVFLTIGAELCAVAISMHLAVLGCASCRFGQHFSARGQNVAVAAVVALIIYFSVTLLSLLFLKLARYALDHPEVVAVGPDGHHRGLSIERVVVTGLCIALSVGLGVGLLVLVAGTV